MYSTKFKTELIVFIKFYNQNVGSVVDDSE